MTADERTGVLFILTMITRNRDVWDDPSTVNLSYKCKKKVTTTNNLTKEKEVTTKVITQEYRLSDVVEIFEKLLAFDEWTRSAETMWSGTNLLAAMYENSALKRIKSMMKEIATKMPRVDGNAWNKQIPWTSPFGQGHHTIWVTYDVSSLSSRTSS